MLLRHCCPGDAPRQRYCHDEPLFLQVWSKLPGGLRDIESDFHSPGWGPTVITRLGDILTEFADVFSKSSRQV